jgi:hypothetical protein
VISLEARKLQEQSTVFSLFVVWWREGDSNPPEPEGSTVFETVEWRAGSYHLVPDNPFRRFY